MYLIHISKRKPLSRSRTYIIGIKDIVSYYFCIIYYFILSKCPETGSRCAGSSETGTAKASDSAGSTDSADSADSAEVPELAD